MSSTDPYSTVLANPSSNAANGDLLEVWRKRLANFRINPNRLEYLDNGKIIASGGFGHVRRAILKPLPHDITDSEVRVAVKTLHMPVAVDFDAERLEKRFIRETYVWSQVRNENLLEFLGFHFASCEGNVEALLVCPWLENGQSVPYVKQHRLSPLRRLQLLLDAAEGLRYLHSRVPPICHGDVKGSNLLVKRDGRGALCDFGLAQVLEEEFEQIASKSIQRGTLRWTSPERLNDSPPAPPMDVWSWGWLVWEIMTEKVPFHQITNASAVMFHIVTSKLPSCEQEESIAQFPALSRLIQLCWQAEPESRPLMNKCVADLQQIMNPIEPRKREETLDDILEHDSYPRKKPRLRVPEATAIVDTTPMTLFTSQSMAVPVAKKTIVKVPVESENQGAFATRLGLGFFPWPALPPVLEKTIASDSILPESGSIPPGNLSPHGGFSRDRSTPYALPGRATLPETENSIFIAPGESDSGNARTFGLESRVFPSHPLPPSLEENIASSLPRHPDNSFPSNASGKHGDVSRPRGRVDTAYSDTSDRDVHQAGLNPFSKPEIQMSIYNDKIQLPPTRSPPGLIESIPSYSFPANFRQLAKGINEFATSILPWTTAPTRDIPAQAEKLHPLSRQSTGINNEPSSSIPEGADGRSQSAITQLTRILENLKQIQSSQSQQGSTHGPTPEYWNEVTQWISKVPLFRDRQLPAEAVAPFLPHGYDPPNPISYGGSARFLSGGAARIPWNPAAQTIPWEAAPALPSDTSGSLAGYVLDGNTKKKSKWFASGWSSYKTNSVSSDSVGGLGRDWVPTTYGYTRYQEGDISVYDTSTSDVTGSVRQGFALKTGQLVALKSIRCTACAGKDASIMSQLDKWIMPQASLYHKNLAQVLGTVSVAENPTIVSEWYPGGNVAECLEAASQVQRLRMICQAADGLVYPHSQKPPIVHSNLKPSNVLIDQDGTVKLGDVGVLQFIEQNSIALEVHGKPGDVKWTAPEVLEGQTRSPASDVYSFGCLALVILKNQLPYSTSGSDILAAKAISRGEMPVNKDQASEFHETWRRCWSQHPSQRPAVTTVRPSVEHW